MTLRERMRRAGFVPDKFRQRFSVDAETGCWLWLGRIGSGGYGRFGKRGIVAHRAVYESVGLVVPSGMQLDHLCRVRRCVNPAHVEPVTSRENILRGVGVAAINARKVACPRGHDYTPSNTDIRRGKRHCRQCERARWRRWASEHKVHIAAKRKERTQREAAARKLAKKRSKGLT